MFLLVLLVAWYQIWPVYSWLEWHRSSSGFSWSSCRLWHQPLQGNGTLSWNLSPPTSGPIKTSPQPYMQKQIHTLCLCFWPPLWKKHLRHSKAKPWPHQYSLLPSLFPDNPRDSSQQPLSIETTYHLWARLHGYRCAAIKNNPFLQQPRTAGGCCSVCCPF